MPPDKEEQPGERPGSSGGTAGPAPPEAGSGPPRRRSGEGIPGRQSLAHISRLASYSYLRETLPAPPTAQTLEPAPEPADLTREHNTNPVVELTHPRERPPTVILTEQEAALLSQRRRGERQVFFHFLRHMRPYWGKAALVLFANLVMVTISVIPPWFGKYLIDDAFPNKNWGLFAGIFAAMIAMDLFGRVVGTMNGILNSYIRMRVALDLRRQFFRHLQRLSMTFIHSRPVGEHMFRATSDVDAMVDMITEVLPNCARGLYEFGLILLFTSFIDPWITVLVLLYMVPYTSLAYHFATLRRNLDAAARRKWQERDAGLQEGIAGIALIKSFGRRRYEVRRYMHLNLQGQRVGIKQYFVEVVQSQLVGNLLPWAKGTLLWVYFARKVIVGELTFGMVWPLLDYMGRLTWPVQASVDNFTRVRLAMIPAERLFQTLDVAPAVAERPGARRLTTLTGSVVFDNVSFQYEDGRPVLSDVSFAVEPGRKIAIVGPSGAGKSTIVNLLLRLHDPTNGQVLVDSHDLRDLRLNSYQQQVGLVMQETYLFGGTIAENLLFMNPYATREELDRATQLAGIYDWIMAQPDGYDQDLREGASLSVGQKQRIAIARAILHNPRLLILDEPTSALDSKTEEHVVETLREVAKGRTTIVVSHRLNTVIDADEIIVMEHGRIVQRGTHADLLRQPGVYRELYLLYYGLQVSASAARPEEPDAGEREDQVAA
jgi:ABC-type multidrug transport system fused ATPase/permease subunit